MACTFTPSATAPMDLVMGMRKVAMSFSAASWLADRSNATPPSTMSNSTMAAKAIASRVEMFRRFIDLPPSL